MSSTLARSVSWSTSMREEAKWTFTDSTPSRRPTRFSILATQEGQEKPSARRIVWVRVGALISSSFRVGIVLPLGLLSSTLRGRAGTFLDVRQLTARRFFSATDRAGHGAGAADGDQEVPHVQVLGVVRHLHPPGSQIDLHAVDVAEAEQVVCDIHAARGTEVTEFEHDASAGHGQAISMTIFPVVCPDSTAASARP